MRSLEQALQDHDIGHLRIIAELWGFELPQGGAREAAAWLAQAMPETEPLLEIVEALPARSRQALTRLLSEGGRLPWADFTQQFGEVREMGPGRRDREKPWRHPISEAERLLYLGLIGRAFADTAVGAKEFAYIPDELQTQLPRGPDSTAELARPAGEPAHTQLANTGVVDDATTLLASLRRSPVAETRLPPDRAERLRPFLLHPGSLPWLVLMLQELDLVAADSLSLQPEHVGAHLEGRRSQALAHLVEAWRTSERWNDFELLSHLEHGPGGWPNEPAATRAASLELILRLPAGQWWDLSSFLRSVKDNYPSFCRPGGDFNAWYLRDRRSGAFLKGFPSWEAVDGALLRALLVNPLHWLGMVDLGASEPDGHLDRVRLTPLVSLLIDEEQEPQLEQPHASGQVLPDGQLRVPRSSPRPLRYQVARLSSWLSFDGEVYQYRLRPSSVLAAAKQGLQPHHLQHLLEDLSAGPLPPRLLKALSRLAHHGIEAEMSNTLLIEVNEESLLDRLLEGRRTGRLFQRRLGPKAATVRSEDVAKLVAVAAEAGLLIEPPRTDVPGDRSG